MGLLQAIKQGNIDLLFVSDDAIRTQAQVNKAQSQIVNRQLLEGKTTSAEAQKMQAEIASNTFNILFSDPKNSPTQAFTDEVGKRWEAGLKTTRDFIGGSVKTVLGSVFKVLPWWLWLLIIAGALVYFVPGLIPQLLSRLTKKG